MTSSLLPLSAIIIAKNEADRLPRTLAALQGVVGEVIVVDSGSSDATRDIAEKMGARVFINTPWPGYGRQKRFAEDQASYSWLINVDADEVMSAALADELRALFAAGEPHFDAYEIGMPEIFPGEREPHPFTFVMRRIRLYHKDKGRFDESTVHDDVRMLPGAKIGRLKSPLLHYSIRSLGHELDKLNRYSDAQVEDLIKRGKTIPTWRLFVEFPANFLKAYIGRRHAVRGVYGFMTAMNYAFYRYMRVAKLIERSRSLKD